MTKALSKSSDVSVRVCSDRLSFFVHISVKRKSQESHMYFKDHYISMVSNVNEFRLRFLLTVFSRTDPGNLCFISLTVATRRINRDSIFHDSQ